MLILIVASGPAKGRIYELFEDQPVLIGREGDPIRIDDRKASRRHARLWCENGTWYVEDLGSRHGTHLNNEKLLAKAALTDGDRVQVGRSVFVLARMPVEHAERMALLGDPPAMDEASISAGLPRRRPMLVFAGAGLAAAVIIALNVFTYLASTRQAEQIRHDLAAAQSATTQSTQELLAEVRRRQVPEETPELIEQLRSAVRAQQANDQLLAEIRDAVVAQPERGRPLLEAILAQAEAQRDQVEALEALRQAIAEDQAQTRPALKQLAEAAQAAQANRETLAQLRDRLSAPAAVPEGLAATLDQILTELRARPTVEQLLEPLQQAIARSDGATREALQDLLTRVEAQANLERSVAALQETLAQRTKQTDATLTQVLSALDAAPTAEQLAARFEALEKASAQRVAALRDELVVKLDPHETLAAGLAEVRKLVEQQPTAVSAALADRLAKLEAAVQRRPETTAAAEAQHEAVLAAIAELKASMPADAAPMLEQVLARLEAQPSAEQIAAALRKLDEAGGPAALDERIAALEAHLVRVEELTETAMARVEVEGAAAPAEGVIETTERLAAQQQQTAELLGKLVEDLKNRHETEQQALAALGREVQRLADRPASAVTAAMEPMMEKVLAAVREREDVTRRLAQVQEQLAALPQAQSEQWDASLAGLREAMAERARQTDALLRQLADAEAARAEALRESLKRDVVAQIESLKVDDQLAALRELVEQQPASLTETLNARFAALEGAIVAADGSSEDRTAILAAVAELKAALPADAAAKLDTLLAQLNTQATVAQELAELKVMMQRQPEQLAQVQTQLDQLAGQVASLALTEPGVAPGGTAAADAATGRPSLLPPALDAATALPTPETPTPALTETELAYKLAFETGQPVTIGAGVMNPATGEISEGRKLDPAAARAAGIRTWREWYLMDDFAERMRLQRQAQRHAQPANDTPRVIRLPDAPATPAPATWASPAVPSPQ